MEDGRSEWLQSVEMFAILFIGLVFGGIISLAVMDEEREPIMDTGPAIELPPPASCEVTVGPVDTPREGWFFWGVVCPEGIEP